MRKPIARALVVGALLAGARLPRARRAPTPAALWMLPPFRASAFPTMPIPSASVSSPLTE